jgi:hypothetical protein
VEKPLAALVGKERRSMQDAMSLGVGRSMATRRLVAAIAFAGKVPLLLLMVSTTLSDSLLDVWGVTV